MTGIDIPGYPEHSVELKYATEHRCGVRVRGPRLSNAITGNDPLKDNRQIVLCQATDQSNPDAIYTAKLIDAVSDALSAALLKHPINVERKA